MHLSLVRWAEHERAPSKWAAPGFEADCDYEISGACISMVVDVGAGNSPARLQRQRRRQRPFGRRQVVVGKRQKLSSERRWRASLLLYREYAKTEIGQQPAPVG